MQAPALEAESVPSARVLPSDVYVYFSIPSVTELKARWGKTAFGKIQNDPAFADFKKEIEDFLEKATREFETQTRMKVKDLLDIPTGEVAVALMKPPKEKLAAVAFLDFGKSEDVVDQLLAKLEDAMDAQNADRKVQEFENTRIVVYTMPNAEKEKGPFKPGFSYFVKDTQLVLSTHVSALGIGLVPLGRQSRAEFCRRPHLQSDHGKVQNRQRGAALQMVRQSHRSPESRRDGRRGRQPASRDGLGLSAAVGPE